MNVPSTTAPRPSKRAMLARALDAAGLLDRLLWLRGRLGLQTLTVLTYHRVGTPSAVTEVDPGLIEVEPAELEAQLAVICARCTPVSLADVRLFHRGKRLPPNPVLLTFDDGYLDVHDVALPLLRRAGVPAAFFIPTAFPDAGRLFWWDRIWLLVRRCRVPGEVVIDYPRRLAIRPMEEPARAAKLLTGAVKLTAGLDMDRLWETIERALGVTLGADEEREVARRTIMGWREVRALAEAGMDVQSHSHGHRVLNTLAPAEAQRDLARSCERLREVLGREIQSVAYPVGYEIHGDHRRATEGAGFELGFTNQTGLCRMSRLDPLNVPRMSMDASTMGALYKMLLIFGSKNQRGEPDLHRAAEEHPPAARPTS